MNLNIGNNSVFVKKGMPFVFPSAFMYRVKPLRLKVNILCFGIIPLDDLLERPLLHLIIQIVFVIAVIY